MIGIEEEIGRLSWKRSSVILLLNNKGDHFLEYKEHVPPNKSILFEMLSIARENSEKDEGDEVSIVIKQTWGTFQIAKYKDGELVSYKRPFWR
jgi:hypothetical protein